MKTAPLYKRFTGLGTLSATLGLLVCWMGSVQDALAFPPQITAQPTNQTVQVGGKATFAVVATTSGSSLTYQWYFQANAIAGATGSSFTRTNAQLADAGFYYVAVRNADGTVNSTNVVLTVVTYPVVAVDNTSTASRNSTSTLSWSHTVGAGSGRLLLVAIATGSSTTTGADATTVTNVAYGGSPLTQVGTVAEVGNRVRSYIYQMLNPPSGTANVVVSLANSRPVCGGATSFSGVDPLTPLGRYVSNSEGNEPGGPGGVSSAQLTGIDSKPGEMVFDVIGLDSDGDTYTMAAGSGQTVLWRQTSGTLFAGGGSLKAGAVPVSTSWTWSPADAQQYALGAVSIKPSTHADVTTTVTGPASVFATTNFTYTVSAANLGSLTASNVVISDALPAGINVVGVSGGGTVVGGGPGQVLFDSASSNHVSGVTNWTHVTGPAANRLLLVGVSFGNIGDPSSSAVTALTYGGVNLTKVMAATNATVSSELWQLVNPPSGSHSVSLARVGAPTTLVAGAATFSGVDPATPLSTVLSDSGPKTKNPSITMNSATNEVIFDHVTGDKGLTPVAASGQVQLWSIGSSECGGASTRPGADFVTTSWIIQNSAWVHIAASVKPAGLVGVVNWMIPSLASGDSTNFTITVTAPLIGTLSNSVAGATTTPDANGANNDGSAAAARVVTTVLPLADVVTTLAGPISVAPLTNYTYTMTVSNQGPSTASNVVVTETLAPTLTYVSSSGGGSYLAGVVTWPALNLAQNATTNFNVTVRSPISGLLTNTAASTSPTADASSANNNGSAPAARVVTVVSPLQIENTSRGAAVQTLNWSHKVAPGSSRILIVGVSIDSTNATVNAATFNNLLPLTLIGQTNGAQTKVLLYRLLNPPVGTFSVSINLNTAVGIVGGAASFNGINQANPITAFAGNQGSGTNASLTVASTLGGVVIDTVAPKSPQYATNAGSAQSIEWNLSGVNYSGAGSSSYGAVTVTPSWALDSPTNWAMGAVALNPATILSDLTLTANGPANVLATSNLTCTITVTNLGSASATNVVVSHVLPAGVTFVSASSGGTNNGGVVSWPALASFAVGARTNYTITLKALATGTLTNIVYSTATTADPDPSNNNGSGTNNQLLTTVMPLADVATSVTGPDSVFAATEFSYTLTVTNTGPSPASDLVVSDTLPAGVTFVSASDDGTHDAGVVTWSLATLASGAATNFTLTVTAPASGSLLNTAASIAATTDLVAANNDGSAPAAQVLTTVTPVADVATTVTGPVVAITNVSFRYIVTVTNHGPSGATSVTVSNRLPAGVNLVAASSGGSDNAGIVTWLLPSLPGGATTNLSVTVFAPDVGTLTNTVASFAVTRDPDWSNNDGTSGAAQVVTGVYPFLLLAGQTLPGAGYQVEFHTYADTQVAMEASTNLLDWVILITTNSGNGHVIFQDRDSTNYPMRFYRSRQGP